MSLSNIAHTKTQILFILHFLTRTGSVLQLKSQIHYYVFSTIKAARRMAIRDIIFLLFYNLFLVKIKLKAYIFTRYWQHAARIATLQLHRMLIDKMTVTS